MVKDFVFIIKMLGLTTVVVVMMQVHLGGKALEDHFQEWLMTSIFVDYMQEATDGGIALTKAGYTRVDQSVHSLMSHFKAKNKRHEAEVKASTSAPE